MEMIKRLITSTDKMAFMCAYTAEIPNYLEKSDLVIMRSSRMTMQEIKPLSF